MKINFTSDWHLYHDKSIIYDERPFSNVAHMHEVLVKNYNDTVGPEDICYFLGDIGFKNEFGKVIQRLNGKKILIKGNHDGSNQSFYDAGFELILNSAMITHGRSLITMSHCPLRGVPREAPINRDGTPMTRFHPGDNWHGESRHQAYSLPDFGQFHLHGHTHKRKGEAVVTDRQWDVGVVGNNYRPVTWGQVEGWIAKQGKQNG